jgi:AcrR family transcriptional regulator
VSLGVLAADLGISKGGIQAVYPNKEQVQLAAVDAATAIFVDNVVAPAQVAPPGRPRLLALIDAWLRYVETRVFPGGCFMAATVPEYDSRPGPIRAALSANRRAWLQMLEHEIDRAQMDQQLPTEVPPDLLAFEIDAILTMGNNARNLADDDEPLVRARALIDIRLASPNKVRETFRKKGR